MEKINISNLSVDENLVKFINDEAIPGTNVDVKKHIMPKSLFFTRPTLGHYFPEKVSLRSAAEKLFDQIKYGKVKINIHKKYKLEEIVQAHKDLEARKITGPAILVP